MGQKIYYNRKFQLLDENKRDFVNLQEYKEIIENIVKEVAPNAKVKVTKRYYMISCVTQSQIVQIGRQLAKTELNEHSAIVPTFRLFEGFGGERVKED